MAIVIVALVVLTLLVVAPFFGYDSRDSVRSKEQEMASYGMSWAEDQVPQQPADEPAAVPSTRRTGATALPQSEDRPLLPVATV